MHTHETDRTLATPEQLAILTGEIALAVAKAKPSAASVQRLLGSKGATRKTIITTLTALCMSCSPDLSLAHCQALWAKLGMPIDCLDDLTMPEIPADWQGIAIIPPISNEALFSLCQKHFLSCKRYGDLDEIKKEQWRPKRPYVLGHRGGVEPDALHRKKSFDQCIKEGLIFLTGKERLCVELLHFAETGEHLDVAGATVTSSLLAGGYAFYADWRSSSQGFQVYGYDCGDIGPAGGPREAVYA